MRVRSFISLSVLGSLAFGCAAASDDETMTGDSAIEAAGDSLKAQLTVRAIEQPRDESAPVSCIVTIQQLEVVVPGNAEATAAIASVLPNDTIASLCEGFNPQGTQDLEQTRRFEVSINAFGILSASVTRSSYMTGNPHGTIFGDFHSFDLRTGRALKLPDFLDQAGLDLARASCLSYMEGYENPEAICDASFTIARTGLRMHLPARGFIDDQYGSITPWSELKEHLKPGPVADFVAAYETTTVSSACADEVALECARGQIDECHADPTSAHRCVFGRESFLDE